MEPKIQQPEKSWQAPSVTKINVISIDALNEWRKFALAPGAIPRDVSPLDLDGLVAQLVEQCPFNSTADFS
jgi:hypothetical protein